MSQAARLVELTPPAVNAAMRGLDSAQDEIAVGLAKAARSGSSVAPGRLLEVVNRPA